MIHTYKETLEEANKARRMGAIIYTVGVHEYNKQQPFMKDETRENMHLTLPLQHLNVLLADSYQVSISGHGFDNTKSLSQILCRFTFNDSRIVDEAPNDKNKTTISCPGPKILHSGEQDNPKQDNTRQDNPKQDNTRRAYIPPLQGNTNINWILLLFLPVLLVVLLLLLCCYWKLRRRKPKKRPPPPPRPEKCPPAQEAAGKTQTNSFHFQELEEDLPPPSKSPPAPRTLPPPAPSSVNPNPTVIVACCGCGNRRVQGNLDTCYNYFQPSCHQMPVMWCHPKVQGRCANFTVVNPSCSQASCSPKICLGPNRNCYLTQAPCTSRIVLQPSGECFSIPQASCSPKICLGTSRDCVPVTQTLCSKICPPNQKYYTINYSQSPCSTRCTSSPSRMLPLLTPHTRQSLESLCHTYPDRPSSKRQKF
ncbi:hypothetical protein A6R68_10970, partial [Neotoma lepida]